MARKRSQARRLRVELMEDRRMMAVFTVDDSFSANDPAARQFTTIQAAVNAAVAGDTIKVKAGTYEENVLVNKQLTIKGADPKLGSYLDPTKASIVDPINNTATGGLGIGFDLQANGIEIEGFTIGEFDNSADADGTIGIRTSASFSGYEIEDNVIENNTIGIYLNSATSTTTTVGRTEVEDNVIRDNDRAGTNTGNGIFSNLGLQNAKIKDNEFTGDNDTTSIRIIGSGSGATATVQSGIEIKKNDFEGVSGAGVYFENVVDSEIEKNDFEDVAFAGIQLNGGNENVTISKNELERVGTDGFDAIILSDEVENGANEGNLIRKNEIEAAGLNGIAVFDSTSNTIERNKIKGTTGVIDTAGDLDDGGNGILLDNADNNTVRRNKVKESAGNGLLITATSTGNTLERNKSKDNNTADASAFDFSDFTTGGTGPSGVQNTYSKNKGGTQNKTGLIAKFVS